MAETGVSDHGDVATTQVVRPRRGRQTIGDMARSLGLMAVVVAAVLLIGPARSLVFPGSDRMPAVDYSGQVRGFHTLTGTPALVPASLPKGWRATSSNLVGGGPTVALHIGWAAPHSTFAGLAEGVADPTLLRTMLGRRGQQVVGSEQIRGATWQRRVSDRGETAFTRTVGRVTLVITGNASDAQLRLLAASLR